MTRDSAELAICIATFRGGDGLRRLLESLLKQDTAPISWAVILVDNDPEGSARSTFESYSQRGMPICYVVEPDPGIPAARNRSIAVARELGVRYVAFIDDDETTSARWISALVEAAEQTGADAVSGPVEPIFPLTVPSWARNHGLYDRPISHDHAELDYASTANSLLRLSAIAGIEEPFPSSFRFTGGSDTWLYQGIRKRGGRIVFSRHALVCESITERRISTSWIIARKYRQGITLARCDRAFYGWSGRTATRFVRGCGLIAIGTLRLPFSAIVPGREWRVDAALIARGVGSIVGLFGLTYQEYLRN
jgi:succinoglycan biosynthesis protein ExoM